jgi:asparagine synthase (glutamine-hydrolysing)
MGGIAGMMLKPGQNLDPRILDLLRSAISHRGPDGAGQHLGLDVAFLHARLAAIDLQKGGQPINSGPLALVADAEIYNDLTIRAERRGKFATASDCETPLNLFARHSAGFASHLRGMYAIAIHDQAFGTLTLCRDPFGIKPLYIAQVPAGLVFASELQALLNAGSAPRQINSRKLDELLNLQFCTGTKTIFRGVSRVNPGATLTAVQGKIKRTEKIHAVSGGRSNSASTAEAIGALDFALQESLRLHLRAETPLGLFLSGGICSAVLLASAARLGKAPYAFTAGFATAAANHQRLAAAAIANATGARHEHLEIDRKMVFQHLPEMVAAMDDPVASPAIIPCWLLARHAAKEVKIILTGDGGNEMFAGYARYRNSSLPYPFTKKAFAKGIFDGLDVLRQPPFRWRENLEETEAGIHEASRFRRARRLDVAERLPNCVLLRLDRCLAAHGVEARTPYLDPQIAQFAFSLPKKRLIANGQGKYLLRLWLQQNLPAANPFSKNQGFRTPVGNWIASSGARLGELVARNPLIIELAEPDKVKALFARAEEKRLARAAWGLLFIALWHRRHILDLPPAGDVFETLAAL